jgi:5-methylthioadenosine/S-adenosylhomocysteine deaminase
MKIDILIKNCMVLPHAGEHSILTNAFIAIGNARILQIGPMEICPPADTATVVDGQGQLAMSGFVNGHCHAPMTLFRGMADDLALMTWLNEHIFPAEARHVNPEMAYWCAKLAAAESLLGGVTTVADGYFFEDEVARAFAETGCRCVAAQAVIDFPAPGVPDPKYNIEAAERFLDRWQDRHPLVHPAIFAHSPYTCTNETLIKAKELTRHYQVPLFLHLAETRDEIKQVADPLAITPIRHVEALGLLDRDTVCVHCVWTDDQDIDLLAQRGAGVIICPQSHCKLASGRASLRTMLQRQVRVGLGTDGAASNNSLDIFREMDITAKIQKVMPSDPVAVPAQQILAMATKGCADAIGMDALHGILAPGKPADLILIDLQQPHLQPFFSPHLLVYSGSPADIRTVIVNGKLVVRNRKILTINLQETMDHVRQFASILVGKKQGEQHISP